VRYIYICEFRKQTVKEVQQIHSITKLYLDITFTETTDKPHHESPVEGSKWKMTLCRKTCQERRWNYKCGWADLLPCQWGEGGDAEFRNVSKRSPSSNMLLYRETYSKTDIFITGTLKFIELFMFHKPLYEPGYLTQWSD